jgi:hypothetical protein
MGNKTYSMYQRSVASRMQGPHCICHRLPAAHGFAGEMMMAWGKLTGHSGDITDTTYSPNRASLRCHVSYEMVGARHNQPTHYQ